MKLFVTAGGSMGHINPALAIIDEFKKREKNGEQDPHSFVTSELFRKRNIKF